jgi:hypothetical protein
VSDRFLLGFGKDQKKEETMAHMKKGGVFTSDPRNIGGRQVTPHAHGILIINLSKETNECDVVVVGIGTDCYRAYVSSPTQFTFHSNRATWYGSRQTALL